MRKLIFFACSLGVCGDASSSGFGEGVSSRSYDIAYNNIKPISDNAGKKLKGILSHRENRIKFAVVGMEKEYPPVDVKAKTSYYSVIVDDEDIVSEYLLKIGVNKKNAQEIIGIISNEAVHDNGCEGERSTCVLINDKLKFVNDYYGNTLRVFIPSGYFSPDVVEPAFLNPNLGSNQLVSNIYANYDGNTSADSVFFLTTNNYLGVGFGYININGVLTYNSSALNSFEYIADFNKYTLSLGYASQDNGFYPARQNSILLGSDFFGLSFGKTNNLIVNDDGEKTLSFFSPSSGTVEIFKNNEVVYQGYIGSGHQRIPYSSLPLGNYNVEIEVKNNGSVVFNGRGLVSNVRGIKNDSFMPYFRLGILRSLNDDGVRDYKDEGLLELGASYPLIGGVNVTANGYLIGEQQFYSVGLDFQSDGLYSNIKYTKSDGFEQSKINLGYGYFNFQISDGTYDGIYKNEVVWLEGAAVDNNRGNYIGSYSRLQGSLSVNIPITNSYSVYGNGFYTKDRKIDFSTYSYSVGGTYRSSSNVNVSMDYSILDGDNKIGLSLNIPFGNEISYSSSSSLSRNRQVNNYLNYNNRLSDTISTSLMVGYNYNKYQGGNVDNYSSVSGSISQYNDSYSGSVRVSNNPYNTNYGFTLNTTQLLNSAGFFYTSQSNIKSSILIKNKERAGHSVGDVQLIDKKHGRYSQYHLNDETMIYLDGYNQKRIKYQFNEDNNFVGSDKNAYKNIVDLSPGRVEIIDIDVVNASQVLVITPKLNIDNVRCEGEGCLSIKKIQKSGVKVLTKPNMNVNIYVGGNICWSGMLEKDINAVALCEIKQ